MRTYTITRPAHLEGLERYEPGKPIEEVQREMGLRRVIKLASNENPLGPSPAALAAAHAALTQCHRYPDGPGTLLRRALARRHKVEPSQIVIGNGSTDLIDLLTRAFLGPGDSAVIAQEGFARFRQCVNARNGGVRLVAMRDHTHDLLAMARAVEERTRLVFVANPNNPTGTWNKRSELEAFLDALPGHGLLVLDEAYFDYADHPDYPNGLDYVRGGAPVVVLRSFSKVFGLAGLRVGYAVAAPEVVEAIDTVREPFNTNVVGHAAALAAIDDNGHLVRSLELNRVEKAKLEEALISRGLPFLPSLANFLCVDVGQDGTEVWRRLLARGMIVRPLRPYGLNTWLRVSVGTPDENETFLEALDAVLGPSRP
jgi:histidinol-phosphate aminotransferase